MMTDVNQPVLQDPMLQNLFAEACEELQGNEITERVMARTRTAKYLFLTAVSFTVVVILLISWLVFAGPLLDFALLVSGVLTMTLVDLGEGWLALALMPVNNIASLFVLMGKAALIVRKKLLNRSLAV